MTGRRPGNMPYDGRPQWDKVETHRQERVLAAIDLRKRVKEAEMDEYLDYCLWAQLWKDAC